MAGSFTEAVTTHIADQIRATAATAAQLAVGHALVPFQRLVGDCQTALDECNAKFNANDIEGAKAAAQQALEIHKQLYTAVGS